MDLRTPATLTDVGPTASPQAMTFIQQPTSPAGPWGKYRKAIFGIGRAEAFLGALLTLLGIFAAIVGANVSDRFYCGFASSSSSSSQGIWCGLLLATTGALGMSVKNKPSRGLHVANMTMAIITSVVLGVGVILSAFGALASYQCSQALVWLHTCVAVICFASMVITIVHAAYCCGGICCKESSDALLPDALHGQQQITNAMQHQYVYGPNRQVMVLTAAPQMPNASRQLEPPPVYAPPEAMRNIK